MENGVLQGTVSLLNNKFFNLFKIKSLGELIYFVDDFATIYKEEPGKDCITQSFLTVNFVKQTICP